MLVTPSIIYLLFKKKCRVLLQIEEVWDGELLGNVDLIGLGHPRDFESTQVLWRAPLRC